MKARTLPRVSPWFARRFTGYTRWYVRRRFRALRVAKAIRTGVVSVNSNSSVHTEAPFGGYKMSGIGRELGMHAIEGYTELKNVFVDLG